MYLIQILLVLFFVLTALKTWGMFKKNDIGRVMMVFWMVLWFTGMAVAMSPNSTFYLARVLGVQRGADAVVYLALALLFFVLFKLIVQVEKLETNVTFLTRELSLKNKNDIK